MCCSSGSPPSLTVSQADEETHLEDENSPLAALVLLRLEAITGPCT